MEPMLRDKALVEMEHGCVFEQMLHRERKALSTDFRICAEQTSWIYTPNKYEGFVVKPFYVDGVLPMATLSPAAVDSEAGKGLRKAPADMGLH